MQILCRYSVYCNKQRHLASPINPYSPFQQASDNVSLTVPILEVNVEQFLVSWRGVVKSQHINLQLKLDPLFSYVTPCWCCYPWVIHKLILQVASHLPFPRWATNTLLVCHCGTQKTLEKVRTVRFQINVLCKYLQDYLFYFILFMKAKQVTNRTSSEKYRDLFRSVTKLTLLSEILRLLPKINKYIGL